MSKRKLTGVEREVAVTELLESICSPPNFVEYDYSPPKTVAACKFLLGKYVLGKYLLSLAFKIPKQQSLMKYSTVKFNVMFTNYCISFNHKSLLQKLHHTF